MKKRFLSLLLTLAICMGFCTVAYAGGLQAILTFYDEDGVLQTEYADLAGTEEQGTGWSCDYEGNLTLNNFTGVSVTIDGGYGLKLSGNSSVQTLSITTYDDSFYVFNGNGTLDIDNSEKGTAALTVDGSVTFQPSVIGIRDGEEVEVTLPTGADGDLTAKYADDGSVATHIRIGGSGSSTDSSLVGPNVRYTLENGVLTLSGSGETYSRVLFYNDRDNIKSIVIGDGITTIGSELFAGLNNVTSVTIPNSVTSIGTDAFAGCTSLTSVTIPNSVTSIEGYTFYDCTSLASVTIPNSVTNIGVVAFFGCTSLASVTIPNSVTTIESSAFSRCTSLTSVTIPNSVTSMGVEAFSGCTSLTSVTISSNVTSIETGTFNECSSLTSATIPAGVTSVGAIAFYGCTSLTSVTIPNSVTSMGVEAFYGCTSLTSVTIPNSVTSIGAEAFADCTSLTSVTIPSSVTSIGNGAFYGCTNLTIYGEAGSYAQTYATENNIKFVAGEAPDVPTPPAHEHSWNTSTWEKDASSHWHACAGCTEKSDAAAHSYGSWTVTQAATSSAAGSRYHDCTVCGYRETQAIPATGGGSSSGGSSGGGSSSGSSSTSNPTTTTRNPDGSTTTTTTNNRTGAVTATTTDREGNKTQTVTQRDGSSVATVTQKDGTTATVTTSAAGKVEAEVKLPAAAVSAAQESGEAVSLPIPAVQAARSTAAAPAVTVSTGSAAPVKVEIPAAAPTPGTVAVLVKADGTEEVIKASVPTENGIAAQLPDGATVKIVDNSRSFSDVPAGNWAADAITFASARELFSGTGADTFSPDLPMTRAMLVTVLARFDGADISGGETWYEKSVEWAVANGISDGSSPEGNISREQLAVMLWRYAGSPAASASLDGFADAGEVSGYAQEALRWAVENGVISGYGNGQLGPQGQATRAQVAQMLKNFIEKT